MYLAAKYPGLKERLLMHIRSAKKPNCSSCPYYQGAVYTAVSPCPACLMGKKPVFRKTDSLYEREKREGENDG